MKNMVITYGLAAEQVSLLRTMLPEGYNVEITDATEFDLMGKLCD